MYIYVTKSHKLVQKRHSNVYLSDKKLQTSAKKAQKFKFR